MYVHVICLVQFILLMLGKSIIEGRESILLYYGVSTVYGGHYKGH